MFYSTLLVGATTWLVAQILSVPLRPLNVNSAFGELKNKWKPLLKTVTLSTLIALLGYFICFFPGVFLSALFMLIAPAIMMEGLSGRKAIWRSVELVKRSFLTVLGTSVIVYMIPIILAFVISFAIQGTIKGFVNPSAGPVQTEQNKAKDDELNITVGPRGTKVSGDDSPEAREKRKNMERRIAVGTGIFELVWMPLIFVISSFTSTITALLYFKTRRAGGESMQDLLEKFEDAEHPQSKWQHRIRERLIQSGRISSTEKR
jgi:hypothetical protein